MITDHLRWDYNLKVVTRVDAREPQKTEINFKHSKEKEKYVILSNIQASKIKQSCTITST